MFENQVSVKASHGWSKFIISGQLVVTFHTKCCTQYAVVVDHTIQADCVTKSNGIFREMLWVILCHLVS